MKYTGTKYTSVRTILLGEAFGDYILSDCRNDGISFSVHNTKE